MKKKIIVAFAVLFVHYSIQAQGSITINCDKLHISNAQYSLRPMSNGIPEDDPGYLAGSYASLWTWYAPSGKQDDNYRIEIGFPSRVGHYHWAKSGDNDKCPDSLRLWMSYTLPDGSVLQCNAENFDINITRYDAAPNGIVEGTLTGQVYGDYWRDTRINGHLQITVHFIDKRGNRAANEQRNARPAELAAMQKLQAAINSEAAHWEFDDWKFQGGKTQFDFGHLVATQGGFNYGQPIRILANSKLSLQSQSVQTQYYSALKAVSQPYQKTGDMATQMANDTKTMDEASNIKADINITIDANAPYMPNATGSTDGDEQTTVTELHAAGATRIYKTVTTENKSQANLKWQTRNVSYAVVLGSWNVYTEKAFTNIFYKFKHARLTPYIENVVLTFDGNEAAIEHIINSTDWIKVAAGLTP